MFPVNCMLIDTDFRIKVGKHFWGQPVLAIILNIINESQLSSGGEFLAGWAQSRSEARVQPASPSGCLFASRPSHGRSGWLHTCSVAPSAAAGQ